MIKWSATFRAFVANFSHEKLHFNFSVYFIRSLYQVPLLYINIYLRLVALPVWSVNSMKHEITLFKWTVHSAVKSCCGDTYRYEEQHMLSVHQEKAWPVLHPSPYKINALHYLYLNGDQISNGPFTQSVRVAFWMGLLHCGWFYSHSVSGNAAATSSIGFAPIRALALALMLTLTLCVNVP